MKINCNQSKINKKSIAKIRLIGVNWGNMSKLVDQFTNASATAPLAEVSERIDDLAALRTFITGGGYGAGDRLPSERDLIVKLGMSRNALRKALDALEYDGTIWRHVGKGTFVAAQNGSKGVDAIAQLSEQMSPVRIVQARLCIEPSLAREAAINGSQGALARMNNAIVAARSATTWAEYEAQDDLFHRAIAQASDNILLLTLFDHLNAVRREVSGGTVVRATKRPTPEHKSFDEHDWIAAAITRRDPHAAHMAMRRHIGSVSDRLFGEV